MNFKKLHEKENILLQRNTIIFEVSHENSPTPKKHEVKKEIAKNLKVDENLITIKNILTKFGLGKSEIISNIYKNENTLKRIEKSKKFKGKTEEKAAESKAEPKTEKNKEITKEDGKEEKSKE